MRISSKFCFEPLGLSCINASQTNALGVYIVLSIFDVPKTRMQMCIYVWGRKARACVRAFSACINQLIALICALVRAFSTEERICLHTRPFSINNAYAHGPCHISTSFVWELNSWKAGKLWYAICIARPANERKYNLYFQSCTVTFLIFGFLSWSLPKIDLLLQYTSNLLKCLWNSSSYFR